MSKAEQLIGLVLGQYEIVGYVGKGGMATVYRGVQKNINRNVAIKVLPRNFTHDDTFMHRFRREAALVAALEHPHILPVYDYGEYDDMPYIVLRYVDGGSLHERIRKRDLTFRDIAKITRQIAGALDYAHEHGVLHRDVKPSNILLDGLGNGYLTDFGLARVTEGMTDLTGSNIVGTPAYIAPEQADQGPQLPAMDIYSLGVSVFEMLAGTIPYKADTPIAQILAHVQRPVPSVRIYNSNVPMEVDMVLKRTLAKRPEDRYITATAMAEALEEALMQPVRSPVADPVMTPVLNGAIPPVDFIVEPPARDDKPITPPPVAIPTPVPQIDAGLKEPAPKTVVTPTPMRRKRSRFLWALGLMALAIVAISIMVTEGRFGAADRGSLPPASLEIETQELSATQENEQTAEQLTPTTEPTVEAVEPTATLEGTIEPTAQPTVESGEPTPTVPVEPTALPEVLVQGIASQMVLIPEGPFMMGSRAGLPSEAPVHEVYLDAYYIDVNEVTNEEYAACVAQGGCAEPAVVRSRRFFTYYGEEAFLNYPVINVTWHEAQTYCLWRGAHLPTEAQWEKAARWDPDTSTSLEFPWGTSSVDEFYLNFGGTRIGDTITVGSFPAGQSPFGVNDMAGNVAEWVLDWFAEDFYAYTPYANPVGPDSGEQKIYRGGSYASFGSELRTAARQHIAPQMRSEAIGFRCAYTPGGPPTVP